MTVFLATSAKRSRLRDETALAGEMMIFVKGLSVKTIALEVDLSQDLASLRAAIQVLSWLCKLHSQTIS